MATPPWPPGWISVFLHRGPLREGRVRLSLNGLCSRRGTVTVKSVTEICEILNAYDLTRSVWSAAELVGCRPRTVKRYVELRDSGRCLVGRERSGRLIDPFLEKIEEKVEASKGKICADVVHDTVTAMGFTGTERATRRAVAEAKKAYKAGRRRGCRPWIAEPGLWLQFDWGEGPRIGGRRTKLVRKYDISQARGSATG